MPPSGPIKDDRGRNRPLRVGRFTATRAGDPQRGPMVSLNPSDASERLLNEGELAWVYGPRRQELAEVRLDPSLVPGEVALRDVVGVAPSEIVRVIKPDLDRRPKPAGLP
jgi:anaerobic selenocysteine-containing dehydrogenase